jgi:hypothetical protein
MAICIPTGLLVAFIHYIYIYPTSSLQLHPHVSTYAPLYIQLGCLLNQFISHLASLTNSIPYPLWLVNVDYITIYILINWLVPQPDTLDVRRG